MIRAIGSLCSLGLLAIALQLWLTAYLPTRRTSTMRPVLWRTAISYRLPNRQARYTKYRPEQFTRRMLEKPLTRRRHSPLAQDTLRP